MAYLLTMACGAVPALAAFGCLRSWRKRRLAEKGQISPALREGAMALFWMFCGGMAAVTLTPRWVVWSLIDCLHGYAWNVGGYPFFEWGTVSLMPFQTFGLSPRALYNLAGNIVLFMPFGFFRSLLWRGDTWKRALVTGLGITGFIECWQLLVGRAFDIDDLLLNTLGVLCGFWLLRGLRRIAPEFCAACQCGDA